MPDAATIMPGLLVGVKRTPERMARCPRCGTVLLTSGRPRPLPRNCPRCLPGHLEPVDLPQEPTGRALG